MVNAEWNYNNQCQWEVNAWEFGPTPTLIIYNSSGGEVETGPLGFESTLSRNANYTFSVRVPKQFFEGLGLAAGYIGVEIFGSIGAPRFTSRQDTTTIQAGGRRSP